MSMNKLEEFDFLDGYCRGAVIRNLVHIALMPRALEEFIRDCDGGDLKEMFSPALGDRFESFAEYLKEEPTPCCYDFAVMGYLADVDLPVPRNISFNETGRPVSYSIGGIYTPIRVYAPTMRALKAMIRKKAEAHFQDEAAKQKAVKKSPQP